MQGRAPAIFARGGKVWGRGGIHSCMEMTVTFTHHVAKPEYKWEVVIPEGPTVLLPETNLNQAMDLLQVGSSAGMQKEIEALPNGGSRSVNASLDAGGLEKLKALGVKVK